MSRSEKARRAEYIANGLCSRGCGRPLFSKTLCNECLVKHRQNRQQLVSKGFCRNNCGRPSAPNRKGLCQECVEKAKAIKARHKENGLCSYGCGRSLFTTAVCKECLIKDVIRLYDCPEDFARFHIENPLGYCSICQRDNVRLNIDHCHVSGSLRERICTPCNTAMGKVESDPERALNIIKYLINHNNSWLEWVERARNHCADLGKL